MKFLRENNARTRYLSIEECQRLISCCIAPHIRAIVTVALHTGMRLGEILNLNWQDLDFQSNFILIRDSKNGAGRPVAMDATVGALLTSYPQRPGSELVFVSPSGKRFTNIRVGFRNACVRAGITNFRFHDTRHSWASNFMMAGGDIYTCQQLLGHKTATMSQRYAHLSPAYKIKAVDRMNTLWQRAVPDSSGQAAVPEQSVVTAASQPPTQDNPAPAQIL